MYIVLAYVGVCWRDSGGGMSGKRVWSRGGATTTKAHQGGSEETQKER